MPELKTTITDFSVFFQRHIPGFTPNGNKQVLCHCPCHDDKDPSLSVNVEDGSWNCFAGCGGGGPVQFIRKLYNLSFDEAVAKINAEENGGSPIKTFKKPAKSNHKPAYLTIKQVSALHGHLLKTPSALRKLKAKYGLNDETIKKYLIGYQNKNFVIPIEAEPGKWTFKEHKGVQTRFAKAVLYPHGVIKEGMPLVVITEGELKALLLNQYGFPAVSGTGGARTWNNEWSLLFKGLDVVLAFDADDPGRRGAQKVAQNLKDVARNVKAICWPAILDGSENKKDVTDFFISLGKSKTDFQRLIENAQEISTKIKEIGGIKFIEPEGYKVKEDRVDQIAYLADGPKLKPICYTPILMTGCALDVDTGTEEVEITFKQRRRWKKIWVPKRTAMDLKKLVELSDHGLQVNSVNAKKIIEYLSLFEAFNMDIVKLSYIAKGIGWKTIRDRRVFILDKILLGKDTEVYWNDDEISVEFAAETGFERFVKAMKPKGTFSQWREHVISALKYPYACFAFYASFAAPLLRLLKAPNFILDFWGSTSVGKTSLLELAASPWGNPHKEAGGLVFSWDSTKVFLERMASFFCDVPIFPDDSQTVDDRTLTSILYQIANGVGRGRGAIVGIRRNPTWHTVCFSTGERPLTQCTTFSGAQARTIEIYGSPFPNAGGNFINDLKQGIRENYGHAGPEFIKGLMAIIEDTADFNNLKLEYKRYQQMLSKEAGSEIGDRISQYFSVVKISADLVCKILNFGDPVEAEKSIRRTFEDILQDTAAHSDLPTRAMQHVLSWVWGNENFFRLNERGEQYGRITKGDYIGIYRHKLTDVLKRENYSEIAVLRGWADRKWIKREDKNHFTCSRKITDIIDTCKDDNDEIHEIKETKNTRLVIIPWNIVDKFSGVENV